MQQVALGPIAHRCRPNLSTRPPKSAPIQVAAMDMSWIMPHAEARAPPRSYQTTLLPVSPREWLAEDHPMRFLLDPLGEVHLTEILIPAQAKDPRVDQGIDPRMMTMLLAYAY